jgi:hypothetical protein
MESTVAFSFPKVLYIRPRSSVTKLCQVGVRTFLLMVIGSRVSSGNGHPYNSRRFRESLQGTKAKRLQYQAHCSKRAPSYFFLFGYVQELFTDFDYATSVDLEGAITAIFGGIGKGTLVTVGRSWVERSKWVIKNKGRYDHNLTGETKHCRINRRESATWRTQIRTPVKEVSFSQVARTIAS